LILRVIAGPLFAKVIFSSSSSHLVLPPLLESLS
jgi:hypothetical protein